MAFAVELIVQLPSFPSSPVRSFPQLCRPRHPRTFRFFQIFCELSSIFRPPVRPSSWCRELSFLHRSRPSSCLLSLLAPRQIASPPTQQGRASVAICIRLVPSPTSTTTSDVDNVPAASLEEFFARDWVREEGTSVEILYIRRAKRRGDRWSSQLAFPGGRKSAEDENAQYTALR